MSSQQGIQQLINQSAARVGPERQALSNNMLEGMIFRVQAGYEQLLKLSFIKLCLENSRKLIDEAANAQLFRMIHADAHVYFIHLEKPEVAKRASGGCTFCTTQSVPLE